MKYYVLYLSQYLPGMENFFVGALFSHKIKIIEDWLVPPFRKI